MTAALTISTTIRVGSSVVVRDGYGDTHSYTIVESGESDPLKGRISAASPVGLALIGHDAGDTVTFATPGGRRKLEVLAHTSI